MRLETVTGIKFIVGFREKISNKNPHSTEVKWGKRYAIYRPANLLVWED